MKKIVLGTSLVLAMVLATGCGSDDDSKVDLNSIEVAFKSSATYDLSQYQAPTSSQINNYVKKSWSNDQGKKSYKKDPDEAASYSSIRYVINGSTILEYDEDGQLDNNISILSDRIKEFNPINREEIISPRFADKGDYIKKMSFTTETDIPATTACKINKALDSKIVNGKTFNDILEITCISEGTLTTQLGTETATASFEGTTTSYLAKGVGTISRTSEACSKSTLGDKVSSGTCVKDIEEITTIN